MWKSQYHCTLVGGKHQRATGCYSVAYTGALKRLKNTTVLPTQSEPQSTYIGRDEIRWVYLPHSAEAYTATLYVMVNVVKGGGRAPPPPPPAPAWANFSIMMECTPKSNRCLSVCILWSELYEKCKVLYFLYSCNPWPCIALRTRSLNGKLLPISKTALLQIETTICLSREKIIHCWPVKCASNVPMLVKCSSPRRVQYSEPEFLYF